MARTALLLLPLLLITAPLRANVPAPAGDEQLGDGGSRLVEARLKTAVTPSIAAYGPFRVLDGARAALVDATDSASPAAFARLLNDHPGIATLEMLDCPGTDDDRANLALGRMIHTRGIATHVPAGGSVRSGAVELFLAGVRHTADPEAEFAVHAWLDDHGRQPGDYDPAAPENRAYLDYYRDIGMDAAAASAFYAMTNAVPFAEARWMSAADMGRWVALR